MNKYLIKINRASLCFLLMSFLFFSFFSSKAQQIPDTIFKYAIPRAAHHHGYSPAGVELPDHLSVVLGFLAHLAGKGREGNRQPFITDCVLPGMERLQTAFAARQDSPWNVLIDAARRLCVEDCKEVASC